VLFTTHVWVLRNAPSENDVTVLRHAPEAPIWTQQPPESTPITTQTARHGTVASAVGEASEAGRGVGQIDVEVAATTTPTTTTTTTPTTPTTTPTTSTNGPN